MNTWTKKQAGVGNSKDEKQEKVLIKSLKQKLHRFKKLQIKG
jgi:hypothetical protein